MHVPEREPQVIYETEEYVVVRNHPFERSEETERGNGPRGVQFSETVWSSLPRGYTLGRGAAFLSSLIRLGLPVVGTSTPNSVASDVEQEMPALEPVICSSCWGAERRNWG